jgi:CRISPR-associated protein Csm3
VKEINLFGRIILSGYIRAVTGLHVGKGKEGLMIGGVDNPVMRDALTNQPYIPGSSLKGKLRSLAEKRDPATQPNKSIGKGVTIHVCNDPECRVCRIFGIPGQEQATAPTRLVVRDVFLEKESAESLKALDSDLPFTEVKYEAAIDRITSAANPRPLERVPADALFGPFEMVFNIYQDDDHDLLATLIEAMALLEDDYLGGSGSRGSGKVRFVNLEVKFKPVAVYGDAGVDISTMGFESLEGARSAIDSIIEKSRQEIQVPKVAGAA